MCLAEPPYGKGPKWGVADTRYGVAAEMFVVVADRFSPNRRFSGAARRRLIAAFVQMYKSAHGRQLRHARVEAAASRAQLAYSVDPSTAQRAQLEQALIKLSSLEVQALYDDEALERLVGLR